MTSSGNDIADEAPIAGTIFASDDGSLGDRSATALAIAVARRLRRSASARLLP